MAEREELAEGRDHLTVSGTFQSDKYEWCPPGFVPLKLRDAGARDLLAEYARRRGAIDAEFGRDLLEALRNVPAKTGQKYRPFHLVDADKPTARQAAWVIGMFMEHANCSFSRKVEIMYPDDGGALHALYMKGGQDLSNALFCYHEDGRCG